MADSDWKTVDVAELPQNVQEQYQHMKGLYRQYKTAKDEFEMRMQGLFVDNLPEGTELKFGYNFGKLSVAVGPKREKAKAKAQDKGSLGDWLQNQAASGRRS